MRNRVTPTTIILGAALTIVVVVIVATIGSPIIGRGVFHGASLVEAQYPWREDRALDIRLDYGPIGDTVDSTMPNRAEFGRRARDGQLGEWNPYVAGGAPLGSTSASGVLSPLNLPFVLFPAARAPAVAKLIEMAVACAFTYLFLRRLGAGRVPALLAGTMFMTSGFAVAWTNWQHPQVAALIPAIFWATERHLQERRLSTLVPVALTVAVLLVGGFPAIAMWALGLLACYVVARVLTAATSAPRLTTLVPAVTAGVGVLLGGALAAVAVLPFEEHLGTLDLSWRHQSPHSIIPFAGLLTTVAPNAFGAVHDRVWFGPLNTVETLSFLGVVTVLLASAALVLRPPTGTPRGARTFFAVAVAVTVVLTYVGGPVLGAFQHLPIFDTNFIGRMRALLGFETAVLAGLGCQALVDRRLPRSRHEWILGGGAVALVVGVQLVALSRALDLAAAVGERRYLASHLVLPLVVGVGTVALVVALLWPRGEHQRWHRSAAIGFAALFAVEAVALVGPRFPRIDERLFYPTTPVHEYLADHIGADRFASSNFTMYPGTNTFYELRGVGGHVHHQTTWADLLRTADPTVFSRSPTFSILSGSDEVLTSPILDRLAVRWFVTEPGLTPPGTPHELSAPTDATVTLDPDGVATTVPSEPIRAVTVELAQAVTPGSDAVTSIAVEVDAADGAHAAGRRRLLEPAGAGSFTIPVAGEGLPTTGEMTVTLRSTVPIAVAAGSNGEPALSVVAPVDDGLVLRLADGGAVYERRDALPRYRWASRAVVEEDPDERLALLAAGVDPDTVVLGAGQNTGSGRAATVEVERDDPEARVVSVDAEGDGWLVIADALQHGWVATLDGEEVPLVPADHGLVAVEVPDGRHEVRLAYEPMGQRMGLGLSAAAACVLLALAVVPLARRRRRDAQGSGTAASESDDDRQSS